MWRWVKVPFSEIRFHPTKGYTLGFFGRVYWWWRITRDFSR